MNRHKYPKIIKHKLTMTKKKIPLREIRNIISRVKMTKRLKPDLLIQNIKNQEVSASN